MSNVSLTADHQGLEGTRRHPRIFEPGLMGRLPVAARASLIDISLGGAGVEASVPMLPSSSYRLRLHGGEQTVERAGRLIWRHDSASRSRAKIFRCGLAFDAQGGEGNGDLYDFINGHQPEQLETASRALAALGPERTATRFRLRNLSDITIETEIPYRVLTISLCGMLIAASVPLRADSKIMTMLELPKAEIRTAARVISCERGFDPPHCKVALEFVEMDLEDQQILGDYLQPLLH